MFSFIIKLNKLLNYIINLNYSRIYYTIIRLYLFSSFIFFKIIFIIIQYQFWTTT